jgi:hypothetical protein
MLGGSDKSSMVIMLHVGGGSNGPNVIMIGRTFCTSTWITISRHIHNTYSSKMR